jgi:multidrug/hemolysin transport system permease protein
MPISQFGSGLQTVLSFLPGTYATSLIRNHAMQGVLEEMGKQGLPAEAITGLKDAFDCNIYFFDNRVEIWVMYLILLVTMDLQALIQVCISKAITVWDTATQDSISIWKSRTLKPPALNF